MIMNLRRLRSLGFKRAGQWVLRNGRLYYDGSRFDDKRVVYAFVFGGEVVYIGICDSRRRTFRDRMKLYETHSARVHDSARKRIKAALDARKKVEVYATYPSRRVHYQGIEVDLVRGLEYPLIDAFPGVWNDKGREPGNPRPEHWAIP